MLHEQVTDLTSQIKNLRAELKQKENSVTEQENSVLTYVSQNTFFTSILEGVKLKE